MTLTTTAHCAEILTLKKSGTIALNALSDSSSRYVSVGLPLHQVVRLDDGRLFIAYEKIINGQTFLVVSLKSQPDSSDAQSVNLGDATVPDEYFT